MPGTLLGGPSDSDVSPPNRARHTRPREQRWEIEKIRLRGQKVGVQHTTEASRHERSASHAAVQAASFVSTHEHSRGAEGCSGHRSRRATPNCSWQNVEAVLYGVRSMARHVSRDEKVYLPQIMTLIPDLPVSAIGSSGQATLPACLSYNEGWKGRLTGFC